MRAALMEGLVGIERVVSLSKVALLVFLRKESELLLFEWYLRVDAVCLIGGGRVELSGTYLILNR